MAVGTHPFALWRTRVRVTLALLVHVTDLGPAPPTVGPLTGHRGDTETKRRRSVRGIPDDGILS